MKNAIIIPTHPKFKPWLLNCLNTLNTPYPIIIVTNTDKDNQFEMLAVRTGIELGIEEFFVLQDTVEIKDNDIFRILFEEHKGHSVFCNPQGQMFLNKYLLTELYRAILPDVNTKYQAVMAESLLHNDYIKQFNPVILFHDFRDTNVFENKFGRNNMILENEYFKKMKGTWKLDGLER